MRSSLQLLRERFERLPRPVQQGLRLARRTVSDSAADRVPGLAAEAAFFAVLSLLPLLLAVLGAIGFASIEVDGVVRVITDVAGQVLRPGTVDDVVEPALRTLLEDGQAEVLGLGLVLALWSGSRATGTYINAVTIAYDLEDPRPAWRLRLIAFGMTVAGAVVAVVLLPAMVLGPRLLALVTPEELGGLAPVAAVLYWVVVALAAAGMVATFYHVAVPWDTPWRRDVPGALLAVGSWMLGSYGLRFYADMTLRGDGSVYTGIAAPLVVLLWLYVTAAAVLVGAELNAEIEKLWPSARGPVANRRSGNASSSSPSQLHPDN